MYSPMYASTTSSGDEYTSSASTPTFVDIGRSFWMESIPPHQHDLDFMSSLDPPLEYYMPPSEIHQSPSSSMVYHCDQDPLSYMISPPLTACPPPLAFLLPSSSPYHHHHQECCQLPLPPPVRSPMVDYHRNFPATITATTTTITSAIDDDDDTAAAAAATTLQTKPTVMTAIVSSPLGDGPGITTTSADADDMTAADIRPYACCACPRAFARKHDLQRHIRVHTGDKPYICLCCKKAFARTDALKRHLRMEDQCRLSPEVQAMKCAGKRRYRNL